LLFFLERTSEHILHLLDDCEAVLELGALLSQLRVLRGGLVHFKPLLYLLCDELVRKDFFVAAKRLELGDTEL